MKNVLRIVLAIALICITIVPVKNTLANAPQKKHLKAKQTMVDFVAYNISSSSGYVWLHNTVTDDVYYFSFSANTGDVPTKIGEIPASDDLYEGSVTLSNGTQNIQLYSNYATNTSYLYASDMAIGCGACAMVRIGYNN